ncbi:tRNA pseudouridine(54/55) synthase Pus10 [Caldivirga sp.]|uniref:tRNA pseudouridine(54/55) synthase Pus10 n=1 Tax=Caldivirga sp. TaxID=2080243 RepID=UPI0025BAF7E8|nr:tRNA pseudouridine(54/55) synthase Pus10 [Caldivirga sp.]
MSIIEEAKKALLKYPLCDHCLGRLFASRGFMISNEERGRSIKNVLFMEALNSSAGTYDEGVLTALARSGHRGSLLFMRRIGKAVEPQSCFICGNLFDKININSIVNRVKEIINEQGIEFGSFQVGSVVSRMIIDNEVKVSTELGITSSESIKREINRMIGKALADSLGKRYSRLNPDVVVRVNTGDGSVSVEVMPVYIEARYRKLIRGIPQVGDASVASVAKETVIELKPLDVVLHFAGVEGPEVRVLGLGRPMVIEAIRPLSRNIREGTIIKNGVQLLNLKAAGKVQVREIKSKAGELRRVYRVLVKLYGNVNDEQLKSLEDYFSNRQIRQSMGRGKRVKLIYGLKVIPVSGSVLELIIDTQGGFSIRRFITSEGTEPSISGTLGVKVIPIEVDILGIWY